MFSIKGQNITLYYYYNLLQHYNYLITLNITTLHFNVTIILQYINCVVTVYYVLLSEILQKTITFLKHCLTNKNDYLIRLL